MSIKIKSKFLNTPIVEDWLEIQIGITTFNVFEFCEAIEIKEQLIDVIKNLDILIKTTNRQTPRRLDSLVIDLERFEKYKKYLKK
jgi:hypothetical protein